ncbi:DUF1361 domain-containing protein [Olleya sp. YS]|uniref:DUF1361 domain-containing protein n=1 Tax=Olleya sp. YS TaxID=3028318 RepID=UPI0024345415|nr:DUF1361 domain-containing protein [Olleya sp. YS]WGD35158.1 DUF1361 domain-containing protein [Olleya sp. YS]
MKTIKTYLKTEFKIISILSMLSAFSIILLMVRMKLTQSYYYLFLVWNLFLAGIPYLLSSYLSTLHKPNTFYVFAVSFAWLLFLPNAPYIITDLFHLQYSNQHLIWLDTLVIAAFAITGMLLFFKSVVSMETIFKTNFNNRIINYSKPILFILVGFGVYLGRFLRFNSWEIINKPISIFETIFEITLNPSIHQSAWLFTVVFGLFLWVGYIVFKQFTTIKA